MHFCRFNVQVIEYDRNNDIHCPKGATPTKKIVYTHHALSPAYALQNALSVELVAIQCWKDSGSATELFQRKSLKISLLYCALGKLCCL